jgi:hypothetical protein
MKQQGVGNTYRMPAISDEQLIEMFDELSSLGGENITFSVRLSDLQLGSFKTAAEFKERYRDRDWSASSRITTAETQISEGGAVFHFARVVTAFDPNGTVVRREASAWEAETWIVWQQPPTADVVVAGTEILGRYAARPAIPLARSGEEEALTPIFAQQLAGLSELHKSMVRDAAKTRREQEAELGDRRRRLEEESDLQRTTLEARSSQRQAELD